MTVEVKEKEEIVIKIEQEPEVLTKKQKSIERRSLGFTLSVVGTMIVVAGYAVCRIARSLK